MKNTEAILEVKNLKMYFKTGKGFVKPVDDIDLKLYQGESLGLVGESGCGKTTLMKALLKLLPKNCHHKAGSIYFKGIDLLKLTDKEIRKIRWNNISMISQSAMNALDPAYRIGDQIVETLKAHRKKITKTQALEIAADFFEMVGINKARLKDYPHLFSGGMKQRAVIAMSMILEPDIIIADEPTTALDVIIQAQILERIKALQHKHSGSMIIVTHDISVVAQTCDKVAVMYGGKLMEYGTVREVLKKPVHPYSMGLNNAFPNLLGEKKSLISIPGSPPDLIDTPNGCRFAERCPFELDICRQNTPVLTSINGQKVSCHRSEEAERLRELAKNETIWQKKENGIGINKQ